MKKVVSNIFAGLVILVVLLTLSISESAEAKAPTAADICEELAKNHADKVKGLKFMWLDKADVQFGNIYHCAASYVYTDKVSRRAVQVLFKYKPNTNDYLYKTF
jgi:hypothetical protein